MFDEMSESQTQSVWIGEYLIFESGGLISDHIEIYFKCK
jgi:hypothetical protein